MKINDLLLEKAALWVRAERNSLDCLYATDVQELHCAGPCDCCEEDDFRVEVTFEISKFPDQFFNGHIKIVSFTGTLGAFIAHLDRRY